MLELVSKEKRIQSLFEEVQQSSFIPHKYLNCLLSFICGNIENKNVNQVVPVANFLYFSITI